MQVKVFEAHDMATGLKMVKEALGPDALILSTRTIRSGGLGRIGGKPMLEITAAIDNAVADPEPVPTYPPRAESRRSWREQDCEEQPFRRRSVQDELTYQAIWANNDPRTAPASSTVPAPPPTSSVTGQDIHSELAELRAMVKGLSSRMTSLDAGLAPPAPVMPAPPAAVPPGPSAADPVTHYLVGYGINQETAQVVARFTRDTIARAENLSGEDLSRILKTAIARLFTADPFFDRAGKGQRRVSLIGSTGVGKTTTLAKIAAHQLSRLGGRIGLITIDTYRIAAVEQLKVYGEIMRLPVEVVISPRELDQALDKFRDYDLVLIDTAGRSPKNTADLQELAAYFRPQLGIEHHLLLPATSREQELEETIRRFSILPIANFIFSKIDECDQLGVLLNIHYKNDTPISFLTNGQRVPEDLLMPSPREIAELILNNHGTLHHG
ncbi:MAG: flagellar biosynthesis protein FlhF [Desulfobulbus sp.]|jgi:flagellar biosynthesis protein FlhF